MSRLYKYGCKHRVGERVLVRILRIGSWLVVVWMSFVVGSAGICQASGGPGSNLPTSFHDDALNITYFYPAHFEVVPPADDANAKQDPCTHTIMRARSRLASGISTFTLSTIDDTCPDTLRAALMLGPYTRQQILRQLKPYGTPAIIREPMRYAIDRRAAAVTLASATLHPDADKVGQSLYAAKGCAVDSIAPKTHKRTEAADPAGRVVCFDFTTQNRDLFNQMLSFVVQFGNDAPEPLFLSSAYPNSWSASDIPRR